MLIKEMRFPRKYWVLIGPAAASLLGIMLLPPIHQDPAYHQFADARSWLGIPNFLNVLSNLAFLLAGGKGLVVCQTHPELPFRREWTITFTGIALVAFGSAYYHWSPGDSSLVWDRLPMTIAFMGLLAAILAEYLNRRIGQTILFPALLLGVISVAYWRLSGDLRLYVWVQFMPLLVIAAVLLLYRSRFSHQWLLFAALLFYVLAKVTETFDGEIYQALGQGLSGHSIKHLSAAVGCYCLAAMIDTRVTTMSKQD